MKFFSFHSTVLAMKLAVKVSRPFSQRKLELKSNLSEILSVNLQVYSWFYFYSNLI